MVLVRAQGHETPTMVPQNPASNARAIEQASQRLIVCPLGQILVDHVVCLSACLIPAACNVGRVL